MRVWGNCVFFDDAVGHSMSVVDHCLPQKITVLSVLPQHVLERLSPVLVTPVGLHSQVASSRKCWYWTRPAVTTDVPCAPDAKPALLPFETVVQELRRRQGNRDKERFPARKWAWPSVPKAAQSDLALAALPSAHRSSHHSLRSHR